MRVLKRALAIVYLAASIVALGTLVCQFWGPYTYRFMLLLRDTMPRVVVTVCAAIVALGVLIGFFRLMFARREPSCVHPAGERNIEVTLAALSSCARAAAECDNRVMVEHIEARVQGSEPHQPRRQERRRSPRDKGLSRARRAPNRVVPRSNALRPSDGTGRFFVGILF